MYHALEKLTESEAQVHLRKNGFEAWRQLDLRIESELGTQTNIVLLELHSILAASTIEESNAGIVKLKVRMATAGDIGNAKKRNATDDRSITGYRSNYQATHSYTKSGGLQQVLHTHFRQCKHWRRWTDDEAKRELDQREGPLPARASRK